MIAVASQVASNTDLVLSSLLQVIENYKIFLVNGVYKHCIQIVCINKFRF